MARGPDGQGVGAGVSLSDQLFNAQSLGDLAGEFARLPGFDPLRFLNAALPGLEGRGLLERLDWIADQIDAQLPAAFEAKADALEAAMPPALDTSLSDNDFGRFIHSVPGILAVRHGLEDHRDRALRLLYAATKRFSMEFYIRPFLNRWPEEVLAQLALWAEDDNYHVRRWVSEGTRPKLPWARNINLPPERALPLLERLHSDPTRYVTRSVANHMNDLSKIMPDTVVARLSDWAGQGRQQPKELAWMTRHSLRTAVKRGERGALDLLGYRPGAITGRLELSSHAPQIGDRLQIMAHLTAPEDLPVMVDYRLSFHRPKGSSEKVFKLKTGTLKAGQAQSFAKAHHLKGDASTFTLHPGPHEIVLQVNGKDVATASFDLNPT